MRRTFPALLLVVAALPAFAANPPPKPPPKPAETAGATVSVPNNDRAILFDPPLNPLLGVPPPAAGLMPSPQDFLDAGRGIETGEGDQAYGAYQRGLYDRAFLLALPKAERGDPVSQTLVGRLYQEGLGAKQSDKAAAAWFQKAALAGDPGGQLALGLLYLDGRGVKKDKGRAADAFEQAAIWNDPSALYNLGLLHLEGQVRPRDPLKAADYFGRAAAQGSSDAEYALAQLYSVGDGVVLDDGIATMWMARAAKDGHTDAELEYGIRLFNGTGVPKDIIAAAGWLQRSAERGNAIAQNRFARLLATGRGVNLDPVAAARWHLIASQAGATDEWLDDFMKTLSAADMKQAQGEAQRWAAVARLTNTGPRNQAPPPPDENRPVPTQVKTKSEPVPPEVSAPHATALEQSATPSDALK